MNNMILKHIEERRSKRFVNTFILLFNILSIDSVRTDRCIDV